MMRRRSFLAAASAIASAMALPDQARALGRTPVGGRVALRVPWSVGPLDPHDLRDPAAALFASAIADPLYAMEPSGAVYPSLTTAIPSREAGETIVKLREGLKTARGVALDGRDVIASIERARRSGAAGLLAEVPTPITRKGEPLAVSFGSVDPQYLSRALCSPLVALLPRRFDPASPDGTGAFHADLSASGLTLTRNLNAARGASFLDSIHVARAEDLKTSLRSFEAERDDIGWLGLGLYDVRKGAVRFDFGRVAWVILTAGADVPGLGSPGAAQRLVNAIPPERLGHLGLGPLPPASGDPGWTGAPMELYVDDASPQLVEIARTIASVISRPGHEITASPIARADVPKRRGRSRLAIEIVRPLGIHPVHTLVALATAEDASRGRDAMKAPPKIAHGTPARSLTGTLRVGVIGDLRLAGGIVPDLVIGKPAVGEGWDLGAAYRKGKR